MTLSFLKRQAAALVCGFALSGAVLPKDLFSPRLYVNDKVVTQYEVTQRAKFL